MGVDRKTKMVESTKVLYKKEKVEKDKRIIDGCVQVVYNDGTDRLVTFHAIYEGDVKISSKISYDIFKEGKHYKISLNTKKIPNVKGNEIRVIGAKTFGNRTKVIDKIVVLDSDGKKEKSDSSLQCLICKGVVFLACELLSEGVGPDEVCIESCSEECLVFIEDPFAYIICDASCDVVCSEILAEIIKIGISQACEKGGDYVCKLAGYC